MRKGAPRRFLRPPTYTRWFPDNLDLASIFPDLGGAST